MIAVNNLTQVYKSGKGVFNLNFKIRAGEVFGYLGPNGAGKTTTIRNLLGFMNADEGSATINGMDCRREAARVQAKIGFLPGETAFFDHMTGIGFLKFIGDLRRMASTKRRDELIQRFELETEVKIKKMSKGMRQKLAVITAFMHDPEVYILDEPTSGLDPFMQNVFMDVLRQEKERGKTIMMSSHIFEEVQRICDRTGIIKEGRIVTIEDVKSLNQVQRKSYIVTFQNPRDVEKLNAAGLDVEKISERRVGVMVRNNYDVFFRTLADCAVLGLESKAQSLEDIFMKYYGEKEQ